MAAIGDTTAPDAFDDTNLHFVAFVKTEDGTLYELDGRRSGPLKRAVLLDTDDILCPVATKYVTQFMDREAEVSSPSASYLQFSLVALAPSFD